MPKNYLKILSPVLIVLFILLVLNLKILFFDSPEAKAQVAQDNNCEVIGTVGNTIIARCIDPETNRTIYANNIGWMALEE